jgi:hypothetical protein
MTNPKALVMVLLSGEAPPERELPVERSGSSLCTALGSSDRSTSRSSVGDPVTRRILS